MENSSNTNRSVRKKVLGNWKGWNHPFFMVMTLVLSFTVATIVALAVAPEYTESQVMEYALMAVIMFIIVQGMMIVAAIVD